MSLKEREHSHVLIIDDNPEILEDLRHALEAQPDVRVIVCSGRSHPCWEEILEWLRTGPRVLILGKPSEAAQVFQLASELAEKWRGRHADLDGDAARRAAERRIGELEATNARLEADIAHGARMLRASEARYENVAACANDGLWDWDLSTGSIIGSPRWRSLIGLEGREIGCADEWFGRVHPDDLPALKNGIEGHLRGDSPFLEVEYRVSRRDGEIRWMLSRGLAVREPGAPATRIAGSQTDITDRRAAEAQRRHDAFHDALTGLANRALLLDRLQQCLIRTKRNPEHRFAVLFADLDDFRFINDGLGHVAGDQLIVDVSRRLLQCIRATDSISQFEKSDLSRLGGDEFVVLLEGLRSDSDVLRVAKRLQEAISAPFVLDGREVFTGMSFGIAVGQASYDKPDDILRDAHTALHRAKGSGRGGCEFFDSDMRARAMSRWWLETALRRAIEREELRLVYQPIVTAQSGELREFEALLRWQHPERGPISPAEFIPVAEETGLILPLGDWVLREAVAQLVRWSAALARRPRFALAVNVSGKQLSRPEFGASIASLLAAANLPGHRLRLEVTESALMDGPLSADMPARLMDLDVRLQLDDFGTGYSSLSYLHQLPVDALKIDRSFVKEMTTNATTYWMVQSIITLAHGLGAEVIAEGVETAEQLEELRELECDLVQGYYLGRPAEVDQAASLLDREENASAGR